MVSPDLPECTGPAFADCNATMTEQTFADDFNARMCSEFDSCGDDNELSEMFCDPEASDETTGPQGCVLDPGAACACLAEPMTCNDELPGFEYVQPGDACLEVYICP